VISGPKRYDYSATEDEWLYSRDGRAMSELLEDELSRTLGTKVILGIGKISEKAD
jgi:frataxin